MTKEATLPFFTGFYDTWAGEEICSVPEYELEFIVGELESDNPDCLIDENLHAAICDYRDKNPDDDYKKPLPSKYLKGEVVRIVTASN